jgi:hypothetical protein
MSLVMNDLEVFFENNTGGRLLHKWKHYFEIYDRYFSKYRGTDVHIVEFGVSHGGSMDMWRQYFGPKAKIYGVDINPNCLALAGDQVEIFIGDQEDREFLQHLATKIPRIDILLDDGGHTMRQQIATFEELFPKIAVDGVYLCEDVHTSYWDSFEGGYAQPHTYIEYTKKLIDQLNAWHSHEPDQLSVDAFSTSAFSMHYYDSVVVIEKRVMAAPYDVMSGKVSIPVAAEPAPQYSPDGTLIIHQSKPTLDHPGWPKRLRRMLRSLLGSHRKSH